MNSPTLKDTSLLDVIASSDEATRNLPLEQLCQSATSAELLAACNDLDEFRGKTDNLYHRVRALFFLYAIHRFHLPVCLDGRESGMIPLEGHRHLLQRRFPEALRCFTAQQRSEGPSVALSSALASGYHQLAIQTLADQVRKSVRNVRGNQWMFRIGHPFDTPIRVRPELRRRSPRGGFPVLSEKTSVRMDFTHSAWSDIFFLGMDFPEGARVINASIDLAVKGKHDHPEPPIHCVFRVIDAPVIKLTSIDLNASAEIVTISELFDFAHDYLGLVKAAIIAAGIVPPGMEGCDAPVAQVLSRLVGPGQGIEIVSRVNGIPKGSRLAVSTNLLGSLISLCMRATGQVTRLTGPLAESDRRIVAARAILGEWLGGSGGGWQDSGGIWPGIKLIEGAMAEEGDAEFGVSRGRLLPQHKVLDEAALPEDSKKKLQDSLVLVHGGMAQNVGPILEMVTEKYLLRSVDEWAARQEAVRRVQQILDALRQGDIRAVGQFTDSNFRSLLQRIIPWCTNHYTEVLIDACQKEFGDDFWGFWMLGGMAGGGMGFLFAPEQKPRAAEWLGERMLQEKTRLQSSLPFAMDPVVYDFQINDQGTTAELTDVHNMPAGYFPFVVPDLLRTASDQITRSERADLEHVGRQCQPQASSPGASKSNTLVGELMSRLLPSEGASSTDSGPTLEELLTDNGFDSLEHENIRSEILAGRLGLRQNRLPTSSRIEDVEPEDVIDTRLESSPSLASVGEKAIAGGEVAVMTLAAGVGSRWTQGAGVVKALNPFHKVAGQHRSFLDFHIAKSKRIGEKFGHFPAHIVSTGYMTDAPIRNAFEAIDYEGAKFVSRGKSVGLRMIPTATDLQFAWEEMPEQILDEQQEKVRQSARAALLQWARSSGETKDYTDNLPMQCLHPVGHWYEIPNLLRNGTLHNLLQQAPQTRFLMLHNVDTLGATLDPAILGLHMTSGACLSFEVICRRLEDRGGGLARVDGRPRLVEGLAMPSEEDEFKLSYYNSMTTWIDIDLLLATFGISRAELGDVATVDRAVRQLAQRMPTYITLKDVKRRWGNGQEDVFPVCQFEKIWGDMSGLPELDCQYLVVPTTRGQQLKDPAQLDGWLRDGTAEKVIQLCSL